MKKYPKQTKADRVRELDRAGFTVKQIAAKVGCPVSYVYTVRYMDRKEAKAEPTAPVKRGPGRPKGSKNKRSNVGTGITTAPGPVIFEPFKPAPLTLKQRFMALFTGRV
jgi:hypothetical protein